MHERNADDRHHVSGGIVTAALYFQERGGVILEIQPFRTEDGEDGCSVGRGDDRPHEEAQKPWFA